MKASTVLTAAALALVLPAGAAAEAQTPGYIKARRDAVAQAFGADTANRIFSNAYSSVRREMVARSNNTIPGFECPADPGLVLVAIIPFPLKAGLVSWIERYIVDCKPRAVRSFLLVLEKDQPTVVELLPGTTNADPRLQRDAAVGATAAVAGKTPQDCKRRFVTDTQITSKFEPNKLWQERWHYDLCGTKAQVDVTFSPSDKGGTTWSVKLVD
jgi:hypothetical protein